MGEKSAVIHCNRGLKHQVYVARCLEEGTGWPVSFSPDAQADLHVVIGPWFALKQWRHSNTLYIDRGYWDDPNSVSVHWLEGGEKVRSKNRPYRPHPELKPMKMGDKRLYLCDFHTRPEGKYDTVRWHPSQMPPVTTLQDDLSRHDIAIGNRTTALVDAAIHGLRVETNDLNSPVFGLVDREQWITDLAWHNWSMDELASGDFLNGIT